MTRQEKYPESNTFHYHNQNPKNRITGDCSFRAISLALDQDFNQTVMEMAETMCKTGYALDDTKGEDAYLKSKGWIKMPQPKKADGTKYTGSEFCKKLNGDPLAIGKSIVCHIGGHHIVCIREHGGYFKIWDTLDSTDGCIGTYWIRKEVK